MSLDSLRGLIKGGLNKVLMVQMSGQAKVGTQLGDGETVAHTYGHE